MGQVSLDEIWIKNKGLAPRPLMKWAKQADLACQANNA